MLPGVVTLHGGQGPARRLHIRHLEGRPQSLPRARYRDGSLVVKWDLENDVAMKGVASQRILRLIAELREEGLL